MHYLIWVTEDDDKEVLYEGPVPDELRRYLEEAVAPTFKPLSAEDYGLSLAVIRHTFARFSYVLDGEAVYWCVEWEPGLVVLRLTPDGQMAWTAMRSPVPEFGGRTPLPEDEEAYDEDADNPQYLIVFGPWDAQFDAQYREWGKFVPASSESKAAFERAMAPVNRIGEELRERYSETYKEWVARCKENIERWAGEGVRVGKEG